MRMLERRMARLQRENEEVEARQLENELMQQQQQSVKDYLDVMENIKFDEKNEFQMKECIVCMENFIQGM